ncbi:MAG: prolipoprotein diacylglyceryl transferase [Chloroflexota bacterium]
MTSILLTIKIGLDPTIVSIAGLDITWHGLFTAVGVIVGVAISAYLARKLNYPEDMIYNVALALVIGGIIGARGLYVMEHWHLFSHDLGQIFAINTGGISIYGALLGGTIAGGGYAFITKVPNIPRGMDIAAIGGIVGMAVGRIGDVINGEHFAKTSDLPWAVTYTHINSPSFGLAPQHPAVGYELIGDMIIFLMLLVIYFKIPRAGVTFCAWVVLYGLLRFFVSFLRLDTEVLLGLRMAQVISLLTMPPAFVTLIYLLRTPPASERQHRSQRRREEVSDETPPATGPSEEPSAG